MAVCESPVHILIANQHGENRGDEAAMRAMLNNFSEHLSSVRFTLLYQFRNRSLRLRFEQPVEDLPIVLPIREALGLALYSAARVLGFRPRFLLGRHTAPMIRAYEETDLVVSAPGGPYFGDLYAGHELVHWFLVWLGHLHGKPLFLYAPSAGPFRVRVLNPFRRWLFRRFDVVCLRESRSAAHVRELLGSEQRPLHVTADSALGRQFEARSRNDYFGEERAELAGRTLVTVSAIDHLYPGARDPSALRDRYDQTLVEVLERLAHKQPCHVLLLPQLYGGIKDDVPYLEKLCGLLEPEVSWEIVDPAADSDEQQRIFAMADVCIASRYHPTIFSHAAGVPAICIYYEHKALGFMEQLGLEEFAFAIEEIDPDSLSNALDELLRTREQRVRHLEREIPKLREMSRRTTELAVELLLERRADGGAG